MEQKLLLNMSRRNYEIYLEWLKHFNKFRVSGLFLNITDDHTAREASSAMKTLIIAAGLHSNSSRRLQPLA